jgi:pyridoxine 4-dehydrogenase
MQLAGPFAAGTPPDRATAIGVLRAGVAAGVDHIDTAQYYGPGAVNDLIREALYPYPDGLAIVSKVAVRPDDGGAVLRFDDPQQLREGIEDNLRTLRVGQLAAVNLRLRGDGRIDARFDDQLAAMVAARDEGLIGGVGLSNVGLEQLRHAVAGTDIVCVQNLFHLADRRAAPFSRCASAVESLSCRSARLAGRAARTTPCSPARWSPRQPPGSVSRRHRSRSGGCCSWPPTCYSSPGPPLSLTCGRTRPPNA